MVDYSNQNTMIVLERKHQSYHQFYDNNHENNNIQKKDVLHLLKKISSSSSAANSNDLPPKLEFKYSHTLNSTILSTPKNDSSKSIAAISKSKPSPFIIYYQSPPSIGGGLQNMGNTCFLNSVLQCLIYTQPLQNYLLHSDHLSKCHSTSVCFLCEMAHLTKLLKERKTVQPYGIIRNIKLISKHLFIGRQEDAHEFIVFFLDALEKSYNIYMKNTSKCFIIVDNALTNNLIQNIFGGELSSEVICLKCRHKSITTDRILTLSLEINNADSIEKSLENFCKYEPLFGANKYYCNYCKMKNDSKKRFMFKTLPNVLVIHLKRFDNYQRKIQKFIKYYNELDMGRYCIEKKKDQCRYKLVSVLIHNGYSADSGHYYSFLKGGDGKGWIEMNDSMAERIAESYAMNQTPYMFFYQKILKCKMSEPNPIHIPMSEEKSEFSSKKIYWQSAMVNIKDINVIWENKRFKKMEKINKMKKKIIKETNNKGNDLSFSEHEDVDKINNHKLLINKQEKRRKQNDDEEDAYTQMKRNFYQNFHKIDCNFNEVFNQTQRNKNKLNIIKSNDLQSLYNSTKISLWENENSDNNSNNNKILKPNNQHSILSNQIHFITKEAKNNFLNHKIKIKSDYDAKLDQGRKKKVNLHSSKLHHHKNYFQSISDQQYY